MLRSMQELTQQLFQDLLSKQNKIAFCFDYDGTLVELAKENIVHAALFPQSTAQLLNELAKKAPVAIITGRELKNLKALLNNQLDPAIHLYGTHGVEMGKDSEDDQYLEHLNTIRTIFSEDPDIEFEQKRISITIHYLNHPQPQDLLNKLRELAKSYSSIFRIQEGRDFFEFLPININKGMAILDVAKKHPGYFLLYFGDDLTDIYAFKEVNKLGGLSCQVSKRITNWCEKLSDTRLANPLVTELTEPSMMAPKDERNAVDEALRTGSKNGQAGYLINKVIDLHQLIACYLDQ